MRTLYLFFLLLPALLSGQSEAILEYEVEVTKTHRAMIPQSLAWDDIPFMLRPQLEPVNQRYTIKERLWPDYRLREEIVFIERDDEEDWMRLPHRMIFTGDSLKAFDRFGALVVDTLLSDDDLLLEDELLEQRKMEGYYPGLRQFPFPNPEDFDSLLVLGYQIFEQGANRVEILSPEGESWLYDREFLQLAHRYPAEDGDGFVLENDYYQQLDAQGYLLLKSIETRQLANGIVLEDEENYHNPVLNGVAPPKYSNEPRDLATAYPNPVQETLVITAEDEHQLIQSLELRDLSNFLILAEDDIDALSHLIDLTDLAPGFYILNVELSEGTFTKLIQKI